MPAKKATVEIPESKIRNAIWYLKEKKTKKFVCNFLGINYNTKRLDKIIADFHEKNDREARLKKAARTKIFTETEKRNIAKSYLAGETQSALAKQFYISPQKIKKFLIETNTPIRGRGKHSTATVDHIVQDLEVKFSRNDKVFIAKYNCFGIVDFVYDEDYIEYLEDGRQKYVEIRSFKPDRLGKAGNYYEPESDIHYNIYWVLPDGKEIKLDAMKKLREQTMNHIEKTGREYYRVWRDDEFKCFIYLSRDELYPVKAA